MKTSKNILYLVLCTFVLFVTSCEPNALTEQDVFFPSDTTAAGADSLHKWLDENNPEGWKIFTNLEGIEEAFKEEV